MLSVKNALMGWDVLPGWFAIGALPVMHTVTYTIITSVLVPLIASSGLSSVQALIQALTGVFLEGDRLALSAVFFSLVMHLATFYSFLMVISIQGVDNQTPRNHRPTDGSLAGRLYACHLNQCESFPYFAAAVLVAVVLESGAEAASLAWLHVGFRIAYFFCYAGNLPNIRSFSFIGSFQCTALVFINALGNK